MTANKPEVFEVYRTRQSTLENVVLLADYKALQAECEKLRNLLRHAQPIIRAHAEVSHMLEGFRPKWNQWDELVEAIDAAMETPDAP